MDGNLFYWLFEYLKVLLTYGFVLFVWPLVVFRKYLCTKSITFRFCFCATVQVIILNSAVLFLGLFHILNKVTMCIFFYGTLIWSLREYYVLTKERKKRIKYVITGTMGVKQFFWTWFNIIREKNKEYVKRFKKFYKKHWIEYSVLVLSLIYGMIYFSYGAFLDYSYGFGDMYVHHAWIYGLIEGQIFSAGVYPEAMHCVIYSLHTLCGVSVYSCMLFLAGIHIAVILLAAYCLMKEVFHWRFSAVFVLILFLVVDVVCIDEVFSMSRLQWTLPQEYAFHTMYICVLYLVLYLKSYKKTVFRGLELKACWDENLFLFMMALAASIAIHFYVTIMTFFICFSFAVFKLKSVFHKKHFIPLVVSAIMGLLIAFAPMGGALLSGIPFQGSIGWALNVINGTDKGVGRAPGAQIEDNLINSNDELNSFENSVQEDIQENSLKSDLVETNRININGEETKSYVVKKSISEKIKSITDVIWTKIKGVYSQGYVTLYQSVRAQWIVFFSLFSVLLYVLYRIICFVKFRILKQIGNKEDIFGDYLPIILASFLFMLIYAAPLIGLPELIAGARLCTTEQMLILMVLIMPLDMILSFFVIYFREDTLELCSVVISIVFVAIIYLSGSFHGYLYYELTRYNVAVTITNNVMKSLPDQTYTIVSPTDEIYQVIQNGWHEELLTLLNNQNKESYTIPTEYVFIFVEKKPLLYAQSHFFSGPNWIASEKYQDMYTYAYSVCPEVASANISEEAADRPIMYFGNLSQSYSNLDSRIVIQSKAYAWCQRFKELYPNDMHTYYEDEKFVCYYIKQNTQFLYNLVIQ